MSTGDWFTLVPLSNFFVRKTTLPGPNTNLGSIHPIASGRIENDAVNISGNVTGNYTWYRLSHFEGNQNTQGKEFREYLLVCRGVSGTSSILSFQLFIPDGGFSHSYGTYRALYDQTPATTPGVGTHNWIISFASNAQRVALDTNTGGAGNPNNESFFFYIMGI
jgi:hypothetical protein